MNSTIESNSPNPNPYPVDTLEFEQVRQAVVQFTVSDSGCEQLLNQSPYQDTVLLKEALERITEMRALISYDEGFPLQPFADLRIPLKKSEVEGACLNPGEMHEILIFLVISRQVEKYFQSRPLKYPLIEKRIKSLSGLPDLEKEISRVISQSGEVRDTASPELRKIRRSIESKESLARQRLDAILRSMVHKGYAQEDHLALREGRLVVPMKDAHAGYLSGVIVDQSASGSTLFVEPLEILESNNEIRRLRILEIREVERILKQLTCAIRDNLREIDSNFILLTFIDVLYARAVYANETGGCAAEISENEVKLIEARHPLLLMTHTRETVIPLSMKLGGPVKTLVITGPNAGGKTVALKTLGLLSIMHAYGFHVPAKSGTKIPLFLKIFADIGDKQSIEQDLSTFSSHIQHLARIMDQADSGSLVLVDEIGSSTDPVEGAALAMALLRHLTQVSALTVTTTHMGELKVFAHEEPGIENGSMIFDQKSLRPTYQFQMGIPGSSYAFEIARRYGIPDSIIEAAKSRLGNDRGKLDQLILTLERENGRIRALIEESEKKDSRLSGLIALYQDRVQRIRDEAETEKQRMVEETEQMLADTNANIERLVKEIREQSANRQTIQEAKKGIRDSQKLIAKMKKEAESSYAAARGDWVVWDGHSGLGEVVSEPDHEKRVLVQWGDIRLKVPAHALKFTKPPQEKKQGGLTSFHIERSVRDEIDLRGLTADEAIQSVEQYLGDAVSTGYATVRIIHGKGTGVLRREIGNYLKNHRLVKNQRPGNWNEGDVGVTVVELK